MIGDIWRATAQFQSTSGDIFQWVWHLRQSAGGDPAPSVIVDALRDHLANAFSNIIDDVVQSIDFDQLSIALWDSLSQEFNTLATNTDNTGLNGTDVGDPLPFQDALVLKFFTDVGRSIGKKYLFGLSDGVQSGQAWVAAMVTRAALFAADFDDDLSAGGATFVAGNFKSDEELFRDYTGTVEANLLVGTQDRRRRGIGI